MESDFSLVKNAIELCEKLKGWKMYAETAEIEGVSSLIERLRGSATDAMNKMPDDDPRREVIRVALTEWDKPEFYIWVKAKITGYFGELE